MGNKLGKEMGNGPKSIELKELSVVKEFLETYDIVVDINRVPKTLQDFWSVYVSQELERELLKQLREKPELVQPIDMHKDTLAKLKITLGESKDEEKKRDLEVQIRNVEDQLQEAKKKLTNHMLQFFKLDEVCPIVGVFGLFNRGKTHILNKIANITLPSGKKVHTRGISFKKPNHFNFILVDTAGSSSPMDREWKDRYESPANAITEKKTLELLIQEMTFSLVDQIIVVVNELTWPDQEYIQILQKKLEDSKKKTPLIVIHNFSDVETEEELLDMWRAVLNTTVGTIMTVGSNYGPISFFKENVTLPEYHDIGPTEHYFLARDGSDAGEKYNPRTYDVLTSKLKYFSVKNKLPIQEQLEQSAISSLKLFTVKPESLEWTFNKDFKIPIENYVKSTTITDEDWKKLPETLPKNVLGHFSIKVGGDVQLTHVANFNGFQIQLVQNYFAFKPPYDVINGPDYFTVAVDLCGIPNDRIKACVVVPTDQHRIGNTHIKITGERTLYTLTHKKVDGETSHIPVKYDDEGFKDKKYTISPLSINSLSKPRMGGEFAIIVDLPDQVSRHGALTLRSHGVFYYSLPLLKTDLNNKPRIQNVEF